ncbi:DMT family transporter [Bacillus andreraoultii]|uniref:DMT family transporter n=1 Tax=Bacillus andreraoultii TaxID=1499685 RepID=UPI0005A9E2FE|nr:DMT family transporter [Bacillus andreraoultii]
MKIARHNKSVLWSLIISITVLWGYAWVLMKASLQYMGPFTFSSYRFLTGTLALFVVLLLLKIGFPHKRYWKHLFVVGILQTAIVFLLVMYGLKFVGAGKSSVLLYSMPIWSSFLAAKFLQERLSLKKLCGLVVGLIGLLIIFGSDLFKQDQMIIIGEILIILAAISWGISNVYFRIYLHQLPKLQTSAFQMLFGTIGIVVVTLIMEPGMPVEWNMESIYYILFTGVVASALCFTVWFIILSSIDIVTATISTLLVPIFGLIFSHILLGEKITVSIMVGTLFIISGIIISQQREKRKSHEVG